MDYQSNEGNSLSSRDAYVEGSLKKPRLPSTYESYLGYPTGIYRPFASFVHNECTYLIKSITRWLVILITLSVYAYLAKIHLNAIFESVSRNVSFNEHFETLVIGPGLFGKLCLLSVELLFCIFLKISKGVRIDERRLNVTLFFG